jgi:hypothetical protein
MRVARFMPCGTKLHGAGRHVRELVGTCGTRRHVRRDTHQPVWDALRTKCFVLLLCSADLWPLSAEGHYRWRLVWASFSLYSCYILWLLSYVVTRDVVCIGIILKCTEMLFHTGKSAAVLETPCCYRDNFSNFCVLFPVTPFTTFLFWGNSDII